MIEFWAEQISMTATLRRTLAPVRLACVSDRSGAEVSDDHPERRAGWRDEPARGRLTENPEDRSVVLERHAAALELGMPTYLDPVSGFGVFTADFLADRGYCCESGCRHCPFAD